MTGTDLPDIHTGPTGRPILNENGLGTVPSRSSSSGSTATATTSDDNEVILLGHGRHNTRFASELSGEAQQRLRGGWYECRGERVEGRGNEDKNKYG